MIRAAKVFLTGILWRTARIPAAGRALVRALGTPDEDVRTIAGIFLVRAGRRSEPLLEEALRRRDNVPIVVSILADIGDHDVESAIRDLTSDSDPEVAQAAREALRVLHAR